jgi:hypothetical protein
VVANPLFSYKIHSIKQVTLPLNLSAKTTRKQAFLNQMDQVVPWAALVELIAPYYPEGKTGRPATFLPDDHAARALHAAMVHVI